MNIRLSATLICLLASAAPGSLRRRLRRRSRSLSLWGNGRTGPSRFRYRRRFERLVRDKCGDRRSLCLRRDHTDLFDAKGKPAGAFDQIMLIYPEDGAIHADYTDGQHVIHYTNSAITPGKSIVFTSSAGNGPAFQLSYTLQSPDVLAVSVSMRPPGQATFNPIATGTLNRGR